MHSSSPKFMGPARFLIIALLYLALSGSPQPRLYSSSPILPNRLWFGDGWAELGGGLPLSFLTAAAGSASATRPYGLALEKELPWASDPPLDLRDLRIRLHADRFVNAFYTTLADPLLEEKENIAQAAFYLCGLVVEPYCTFSLNESIGPRTKERGFGLGPLYKNGQLVATLGGGICKVATTLYNLAVFSDLPVLERHPHSMLVPYVPPGRDATVLWGLKDLKFRNKQDHPLLIWAQVERDTLYIALYGQYDPPLVEWYWEEINRSPTWTIRRENSELAPGETRIREGAVGLSVRTWLEISYREGPPSQRSLGVDFYRPLPHYVEYGP